MSVEGSSIGGGPSSGNVVEDTVNTETSATHPVGENGVGFPEPSNINPEDNVHRTESSTQEEHVTTEDGKHTKVRTSTSEVKEVSHSVHRTVHRGGSEIPNFDMPEFPEFSPSRPYPDNVFIDGRSPMSKPNPVRVIRDYAPSTSADRVSATARVSQLNDQPLNIPVKVTPIRSAIPGIPGPFVSMQAYTDLKNTYEDEIGRLKSSTSESHVVRDKETTKEILQRRIIILESDLKDSKHVSEMLSEDLQTLRKQYEAMVNRNLQTENNNRLLQQRLHELKSVNKKMHREANERGQLLDRLREAYNRERNTQRILNEMEEEHSKLVRDYDVLRQTYNRKEQQIHEFSTERAELYHKLDVLGYEKQQLERVLGRPKSTSASRGHEESRTSRGYSESGSLRRRFYKSSTLNSSDQPTREDGVFPPVLPDFPNQPFPEPDTQLVVDIGFKPDESQGTETKPDESQTSPDNEPKTETEKGPDDVTEVVRPSPSKPQASQPLPEDSDKPGYGTDGTFHSTEQDEDPTAVPEEYCRTTTKRGSRNESIDDEFHSYSYMSNMGDTRTQRAYRNSLLRKNVSRQSSSVPYTPGFDTRTESYQRPTYRRRPLSAYGFNMPVHHTAQDPDVFRSPLPPRSSTSVGRLHPGDYVARSSELSEYTRVHRVPLRRPQFSAGPLSPDPFKYDTARQTREEIAHIEFAISKLKREKRRLEKEQYAGQLGRSRTNELSDMITRIRLDIYDLQSRLALLKAMR